MPPEPFVPLTKEEKVEVARAFSANRYVLKVWLCAIYESLRCTYLIVGLFLQEEDLGCS